MVLLISFQILVNVIPKECNFDLYRLVRVVRTSPPGYRYVDSPLPGGTAKIDCRRPIEREIDRRWLIEGKEEEEEENKKEEEEEKKEVPPVPTLFSLACHRRPHRRQFFSRTRRWDISPCGEKDRGD
ncbi:hypothetical protein B296_00040217, partial [Ensete ventricosum]